VKKLLHFTASWCAPCKAMQPTIDTFVRLNSDIEYVKLDVDLPENKSLIQEHSVVGVPTLISMVDDKVLSRQTGASTKEKIEKLFF
jgi:thioredoxin 1